MPDHHPETGAARADQDDGELDALDVLEQADRELARMLEDYRATRGGGVERRAEHGNTAKEIVRQLGVREAAHDNVAASVEGNADLAEVHQQLTAATAERRRAIDQVESMSRGIQGINLFQGQDFEGAMDQLMAVLSPELDHELDQLIPAIRRAVPDEERAGTFPSESYLRHHAPTSLSPKGPRWYERLGPVSRALTIFDRLRDFPHATRSGKP